MTLLFGRRRLIALCVSDIFIYLRHELMGLFVGGRRNGETGFDMFAIHWRNGSSRKELWSFTHITHLTLTWNLFGVKPFGFGAANRSGRWNAWKQKERPRIGGRVLV